MNTIQNGKGSKSRISDWREYRKSHSEIDWTKPQDILEESREKRKRQYVKNASNRGVAK